MLSRSAQTNYSTAISSPESIPSLQKYLSTLQSPPTSSFPKVDGEGSGHESEAAAQKQEKEEENRSELVHLLPNEEFREIFNRFFVHGHKQLLLAQSEIRNNREGEENMLLLMKGNHEDKVEALRKSYYQLQMMLFHAPKGRQYDALL